MILDYELWRNDGLDGSDYVKIDGYNYLTNGFTMVVDVASEEMIAGRFYQFVYRSINLLGYSPYSSVVAYGIADRPTKPSAPYEVHSGQS